MHKSDIYEVRLLCGCPAYAGVFETIVICFFERNAAHVPVHMHERENRSRGCTGNLLQYGSHIDLRETKRVYGGCNFKRPLTRPSLVLILLVAQSFMQALMHVRHWVHWTARIERALAFVRSRL